VEDLGGGRYQVHASEERVELRVRREGWGVPTVAGRIGALAVILAPLGAFALEHRDAGLLAACGAGLGAFFAMMGGTIEAEDRTAYFAGAFVRPRRVLVLERCPADYRDGARGLVVRVDDGPARLPARVVISVSTRTVPSGHAPQLELFFHAGLVFPDHYLRVDTFPDNLDAARRTALALAAHLGLPPPDDDPVTEPAPGGAHLLLLVMLMTADIALYPFLAYVVCQGAEPTPGRIAVAGVLWLLAHACCMLLFVRLLRAYLRCMAVELHAVTPAPTPSP
jgi:hypothetical protein